MKTTVIVLVILAVLSLSFLSSQTGYLTFEDRREGVLTNLFTALEEAKASGHYKCCIEPPCTMCYMGNWIWDDGTCDCDGMIAAGEWDKVCPECVYGIEEGACESTQDTDGDTVFECEV